MVNLNDLRKKNMKDLEKDFLELDKQITMEKFTIESRRSTKTAQLRALKKDLARIATVMQEITFINSINTNEKDAK